MAVGQGFEPRDPLESTVFKTAAFDHSASPPKNLIYRRRACAKVARLYIAASQAQEVRGLLCLYFQGF